MLSVSTLAQTRTNSPYSIFGIGTISDYSHPISFAMGGVGIAFQDPASINPINPASFGAFNEMSFLFDAGFVMNSKKISATGISEKGSYATLNHLLFGLQVAKNWKSSIGLIPFSDVGYNINTTEDSNTVEEINNIYNGKGGLTKVYWANAFTIVKNLSIGIESGLLFGEIEKSHLMLFPETVHIIHNKHNVINNIAIFILNMGFNIILT